MITVWLLRPLRSTSPRSRATLSVGPPAANGTTMVTGLSGYWAHAVEAANRAAASNERVFMLSDLLGLANSGAMLPGAMAAATRETRSPCTGLTRVSGSAGGFFRQMCRQHLRRVLGGNRRAIGNLVPAARAVGHDPS